MTIAICIGAVLAVSAVCTSFVSCFFCIIYKRKQEKNSVQETFNMTDNIVYMNLQDIKPANNSAYDVIILN